MENVIYLTSSFDVHAQLRNDLHACLERAVTKGRVLPSKSRHLEQMARKSQLGAITCTLTSLSALARLQFRS